MDCSLPGSSVHGIFQARILEWVAMPSSRGSSRIRDQSQVTCVSCIDKPVLYQFFTEQLGKPWFKIGKLKLRGHDLLSSNSDLRLYLPGTVQGTGYKDNSDTDAGLKVLLLGREER